MTPKRTNAATLVLGDTGSGKTTLIGTFAEWVYKTWGKVTRLYTSEPGGIPDYVLALMRLGVIEAWRVRTRDPDGALGLPQETMSRATLGYWPSQIDKETGDSPMGVTLVPPITQSYTMICTKGHPVRRASAPALLTPTPCPTCKQLTTKESCKEVVKEVKATPGFEHVGAVAFDGLTSMSRWGMTDMNSRAGRNELGGEKAPINIVVSGGMRFGSANRAAVGFMQVRAEEWVSNSLTIPGLVIAPLFTALEARATDDRTSLPVIGPQIAGSARTAEVPSWFGNSLGAVIWEGDKGREWRLYTVEYRLGDDVPHLCKHRGDPLAMPEYLSDIDPQTGQVLDPLTRFNLGVFFDQLDRSYAEAEKRIRERLGKLPDEPAKIVAPPPEPTEQAPEPAQAAAPSVGESGPAESPAAVATTTPRPAPAPRPALRAAPRPAPRPAPPAARPATPPASSAPPTPQPPAATPPQAATAAAPQKPAAPKPAASPAPLQAAGGSSSSNRVPPPPAAPRPPARAPVAVAGRK